MKCKILWSFYLLRVCFPVFILFFFAALSGCTRCKTDPILIYASNNLKDIATFKPGTVWVYRNDTTLELDSVVVTSLEFLPDTITETCNNKTVAVNYQERYFTSATSSFFNQNYTWEVKVGQPVLFSRDNGMADTIYTDAPCTDTAMCAILDTLFVNNIPFLNVYERIDSIAASENGRLTRFYSAIHYGLLKKEVVNTDSTIESWSLISAYILQ